MSKQGNANTMTREPNENLRTAAELAAKSFIERGRIRFDSVPSSADQIETLKEIDENLYQVVKYLAGEIAMSPDKTFEPQSLPTDLKDAINVVDGEVWTQDDLVHELESYARMVVETEPFLYRELYEELESAHDFDESDLDRLVESVESSDAIRHSLGLAASALFSSTYGETVSLVSLYGLNPECSSLDNGFCQVDEDSTNVFRNMTEIRRHLFGSDPFAQANREVLVRLEEIIQQSFRCGMTHGEELILAWIPVQRALDHHPGAVPGQGLEHGRAWAKMSVARQYAIALAQKEFAYPEPSNIPDWIQAVGDLASFAMTEEQALHELREAHEMAERFIDHHKNLVQHLGKTIYEDWYLTGTRTGGHAHFTSPNGSSQVFVFATQEKE